MSRPSRAPSTVPGILTGICSTGICAHFTVESIEAQSGHMRPGQGGTDWTALPHDASSSLQALESTPRRFHNLPAPRVSVLQSSHMCVHPLVFLQSGRDRIIATLNPFVLAAVTNRCKLGGLKQHIFFSLPVPEVRSPTQVSLSLNQGIGRACSSPEGPRENLFLALSSFWRLPTFLGWRTLPPSSKPKTAGPVLLMLHLSDHSGEGLHFKGCCHYTGPTWLTQDHLPSEGPQLTPMCKVLLPWKVT